MSEVSSWVWSQFSPAELAVLNAKYSRMGIVGRDRFSRFHDVAVALL